MTLFVKITLIAAITLSTSVLACIDNPPDKPIAAFSISVSPPLKCEETCEIRFPDGCKVDMNCLLRSLLFTDTLSASAFAPVEEDYEGGVNKYEEEEEEEEQTDTTSSSCQGKCLFTDKEDNCRLDLICTLNRDVEGTLRLLRKLNFDAETAILLSLSASSNAAPAACGVCPGGYRDAEGNCKKNSNCIVDSCSQKPAPPGAERMNIGTAPFSECPERCEVRNDEGNCIIDYDCANTDP